MLRCLAVSISLICALSPCDILSDAAAATRTTTFTVSLTLQNDCQISASPLNFGNSGVIAANIDQTTAIAVTCTNGAAYNVGLDSGSVGGSTISNRLLAATGTPTPTVSYQLYRDSARTLIWGQTVGTDTVSGTGNGAVQAVTVYGRIPPQSTPAAGTYSSVVTATVTF